MKNKRTIVGTILLLFVVSGFCNVINVFTIDNPDYIETIPAGTRLYFNFDLNKDDKLRIDFEVIEGGNKDVDFYILNSDGSYVEGFEEQRYIKGTFYFTPSYDDTFSVYFSNSFSLFTSKTIEISFDIEYRKSIIILSPKSTDTFDNGYNYIEWTTTGDIGDYVRIELYYGNSFLEVIESSTFNDGSYAWYLSSNDIYSMGQSYQIRISDYDDDSIYVFSDSFSITIEPEPESFIINRFLEVVIILVVIIAVIVIVVVIIVKKSKKSQKESIIQIKEIPKITYCPECGTEVNKEKVYCSRCGSKIN